MATRKFHIVDTEEEIADGIVKSVNKETIGLAWQNEAPVGYFITVQLDGYVIIKDEEYKLLKNKK